MFIKRIRSIITLVLIVILLMPFFATPASAAYENTYKKTGNMRDDIIGVALTQVGYREGSNNYTKYGQWYGMPNSPWCGMFVSWCAKEAGIPTSVLKRTGVANPKNFGLSYKSGTEYTPKKGDLFFKKSFSHVGFVYYTEGAYFYTIEGNTSTTSSEGTSVMIRKRKISDFYFSSPNYSGSGSSSGSTSSSCSHSYKTKVESAHPHKEYKICSKCDKKTYTGNKKTVDTCNTCVQAACKHTFSQWKQVNDSKHNRSCSKCGIKETAKHNWKNDKVLSEATCVDSGKMKMVCTDCGTETTKTTEPTGEHIYGNITYVDETTHKAICKACNKQVTAKHTASNQWQHDDIYHWTNCTDCGGRTRNEEHLHPDGCMSACTTCEYTKKSGHKLTGNRSYSDEVHWEICDRCGMNVNEEAHYFTSDCDEVCNTCDYKRIVTIAHEDVYHADDTGHWRRCTSCTRVTDMVSHVAEKNTAEWEDQCCIHCNYLLRSHENHVHGFDSVESNSKQHWGTCACGEVMAPEVHSWDFQSGTCSICGIANTTTDNTSVNFLVALLNRLFG